MTPSNEQVSLASYIKKIEARLARLETRPLDLKGRKAINASDATAAQDYTTLSQVKSLIPSLSSVSQVTKSPSYTFRNPAGTGTTNGYVFTTSNNLVLSFNLFYNTAKAAWVLDDATVVGYAILIDPNGFAIYEFPVGGALTLAFTVTSTTLGFFGAAPAVKQTLAAYTPDSQGGYGGISNAVVGTVYAQVGDLNALAGAYENLRTSYEDLRTKLLATGLIA